MTGLMLACTWDHSSAQSYTDASATGSWNTARWNNTADGPGYTSTYTANNNVIFSSGSYSFAGMGAAINVGNVTLLSGVTVNFASAGSTFATNGQVRTINLASGSVFDFNGQTISNANGTGFIIEGSGVFATGAWNATSSNSGGFTLNSGTVIVRGTTGLGTGANNFLALNGGTIASNASRDLANTRFPGGIIIGGNMQFGELATIVSLASSSANLSFANNVSLGSATRTLTQGNNGTQTFSGVISNSGTGGIIFAANAGTDGRFDITNSANTFTGDISITGGEVRFTADGSLGNAANTISIDGGRFSKASDATTFALGASRNIFIGDAAGTSISSPGTGVLVYNNPIADISGKTGSWAKQGSGTLELGGASTYTGNTAINNGTVTLTTGNNRLPTGTVLSLGQDASANLGTLNLNGFNQELAGLNSTAGTNASVSKNTVTSASAAILTLSGSGTYAYGTSSAANSGVLTGSMAVVKNGLGSQTFGDANTYTGGTTVNSGTLVINNTTGSGTGTGSVTVDGGLLTGTGAISGPVSISSGGTLGGALTLSGGTTVLGTHSPGFSPGQDSHTDLTYSGGASTVIWELIGNTTSGRGTAFDGINVSGTLDFAGATSLNLLFNGLGSNVDWTNSLWGSDQSWLLYQVGTDTLNLSNFNIFTSNWLDSNNIAFDTALAGSTFSLSQSGKDVILNYSAIPEPSRALLVALGLTGLLSRRRRVGL